jgi:dolichol-phosphate mannosyltransferase
MKVTSIMVCDVSVIVPTYREAQNLPVLVPRVHHVLRESQLNGEILVVDDHSPDQTRQVCAQLANRHPLRLIVRKHERGLASAVLCGMRQAQGAILAVMDADLSHPPEKLPELVAAVAGGKADFALGSRYVPGGGIDEKWGLFRWLNSRAATWLARPLTSVQDPMAGFFALRRDTWVQADRLDPVGYKIALELLVKCGCRRVAEIPIQFADRRQGQSKLTLREQMNYLRHLTRLYRYRFARRRPARRPVTQGNDCPEAS